MKIVGLVTVIIIYKGASARLPQQSKFGFASQWHKTHIGDKSSGSSKKTIEYTKWHLLTNTLFHTATPKCNTLERRQPVVTSTHTFSGRQGVAPQRHLSVGAYTRGRVLASLLCAKRASGVRSGTIPWRSHFTNFYLRRLRNRIFALLT